MKSVGKLVRKYRVKSGFSQAVLGKKLGWDGQFVSNIERGYSVFPMEKAKKLTQALKMPKSVFKRAVIGEYSRKIDSALN